MRELITQPRRDLFFWPDKAENHDSVVIYGAGGRGRKFASMLASRGIETRVFLDRSADKQGTILDGIPVMNPEDPGQDINGLPVVVCCHEQKVYYHLARKYPTVFLDFRENEFLHNVEQVEDFQENIERDVKLLADEYSRQSYLGLALMNYDGNRDHRLIPPFVWYEHPVVHARRDDVIMDIGPFTGLFATEFCKQTGNTCFIHAFEPNIDNASKCLETLNREGISHRVKLHVAGIWTASGSMCLDDPTKTAVSALTEGGAYRVPTWSVDDYVDFCGQSPDFIVLERAGIGEMVLESARRTIAETKPRLMMPVSPGAGRIIQKIAELDLGYEMYFSDHKILSKNICAGFLYAV